MAAGLNVPAQLEFRHQFHGEKRPAASGSGPAGSAPRLRLPGREQHAERAWAAPVPHAKTNTARRHMSSKSIEHRPCRDPAAAARRAMRQPHATAVQGRNSTAPTSLSRTTNPWKAAAKPADAERPDRRRCASQGDACCAAMRPRQGRWIAMASAPDAQQRAAARRQERQWSMGLRRCSHQHAGVSAQHQDAQRGARPRQTWRMRSCAAR